MFLASSPFRFRWASEASRWPQDGPRGPQEGPKRAPRGDFEGSWGGGYIKDPPFDRWPPRLPQEALHASHEAPNRPPRPPKRAPRGPEDAKLIDQPEGNQWLLPSRLFAFDGPPRPQDGSKMVQESPKRGPREPQDGSKSAQELPKSAPKGRQEAILGALAGQC